MTTDTVEVAAASEVWRFLRQVRRRRRRDVGSRIAYVGYVIVLAAAVYASPVVVHVAHTLASARHNPSTTARVRAALPCCLTAALLVMQLTVVRQAVWRGPVLVSSADADWLLALPLPRVRLLRPRFDAAAITGAVVGGIAGVIVALVLHGYGLGSLGPLVLAGAGGFALLAVLTVAVTAFVERGPNSARYVARATPVVTALAVVTLAVGVMHAGGRGPTWPDEVLVWLSPAGWTAQLSDRAAHSGVGYWTIGLALLAIATVAALLWARAVAVEIPARELRRRAATAGSMHASVFVGEFRQARLAVRQSRAPVVSRVGSRPPRRAGWSVPWRDFLWLRRSSSAALWTVLLLVVAAFALHAAETDTRRRARLVAVGFAALAGYVATLQLCEPSRLDADDLRRIRWSPYPIVALARRHAVLPIAAVTAVGLIIAGVGVSWLTQRQTIAAVAAACLAPPLLAAAGILNSYRGRVPLQLIFFPGDLGFGPVGPLLLLGWYVYAPLTAVIGAELILSPLASAPSQQTPLGRAIAVSVVLSVVMTVIVAFLAGLGVQRLRRTSL